MILPNGNLSGHETAHYHTPMSYTYQYDPTADGPEVDVITRILAKHSLYIPGVEQREIEMSRYLDSAALVLFGGLFSGIGEARRTLVRARVAETLVKRGYIDAR